VRLFQRTPAIGEIFPDFAPRVRRLTVIVFDIGHDQVFAALERTGRDPSSA
jgi:hypothetical protein